MSWKLPPVEYLIDSVLLWDGVHRRRRHVVLNNGEIQWTSAIVFLRKRGRPFFENLARRVSRMLHSRGAP
jgi:hypothetical protein